MRRKINETFSKSQIYMHFYNAIKIKTASERPKSPSPARQVKADKHKKRHAPQKACLLFKIQFLLSIDYKFGLILLHSETGGTIFKVTNSSRILHKCA